MNVLLQIARFFRIALECACQTRYRRGEPFTRLAVKGLLIAGHDPLVLFGQIFLQPAAEISQLCLRTIDAH